jgi:hypothetical protein
MPIEQFAGSRQQRPQPKRYLCLGDLELAYLRKKSLVFRPGVAHSLQRALMSIVDEGLARACAAASSSSAVF